MSSFGYLCGRMNSVRLIGLATAVALLTVFVASSFSYTLVGLSNNIVGPEGDFRLIGHPAYAQTSFLSSSTSTNTSQSLLLSSTEASSSTSAIAPRPFEHTISVSGTASAKVVPDRTIVTFAVETRDRTATAALDKNTDVMNNVFNALQAAGVEKNETSTAYFNIFPIYNYTQSGNVQSLQGYTVTNSLTISSAKTQSVSSWIDAAVRAGANRVDNVQFVFSSDQLAKIRSDLVKNAINESRIKADTIASTIGTKLMGVQSVVFVDSGFPGPYYSTQVKSVPAAATLSTPIVVGGQEVTATVNIVYIIR